MVNKRDEDTSVADLRGVVKQFVDERDWQQFHSPKNLSMSLAIEVAELMEHFQWISGDESRCVTSDPIKLQEVQDELADVASYLLALANALNLDVTSALVAKMEKNAQKYPVDQFKGRYGHKDQPER
ncbi:MAG: nucleotide pyrophosphohydrolase [Planctomycetales bacterium]|nr:nucleotide pyrophosphohydrolase [Planctomycetales bacterium]